MDVQRIFAEHYDALYRYLARLTGDADSAADAAQEAFIRLIEREPDDRQIRGWLFRVGTNLIRDHARTRSRRKELLQVFAWRTPLADEPDVPGAELEREERRATVRRALDALSLRERTLLLMREEGFSHQEMAEAVGTTTKSVGSMIARALRKLSSELARLENDV